MAEANAQAIQKIGASIQEHGGMDAVNLKVAEQYVNAFANLAKQGNTLIVPGNLGDTVLQLRIKDFVDSKKGR